MTLRQYLRARERDAARCARWAGPVDKRGYPRTKVRGADGVWRSAYAHRAEFEALVRPLGPGERVYRTCGDRLCVNARHLTTEPGRRPAAVRRPGSARLTGRRARNIRAAYGADPRPTQAELARRYGVSRSAVSLVVRGVTWGTG